jgi:hypothetical protein
MLSRGQSGLGQFLVQPGLDQHHEEPAAFCRQWIRIQGRFGELFLQGSHGIGL